MTLLMYHLAPHEIAVVTDTLASSSGGYEFQVRKFQVDKQGRFIVAGTGTEDLVRPWMKEMISADCSTLEDIAERSHSLSTRWGDIQAKYGPGAAQYATAYGFGFSAGRATRVRLSSRNGFVAEYNQRQGLQIRPGVPAYVWENSGAETLGSSDDDDLFAIATAVAVHNRSQTDSVPIGGKALVARIDSWGRQTTYALGRLP